MTKSPLCILALFAIAGCRGKPSIVGAWQSFRGGDNFEKTQLIFKADGRYQSNSNAAITSQNFTIHTRRVGTYELNGNRLTIDTKGGVTEILNRDGTVRKSTQLRNPSAAVWSKIKLSDATLTMGDPDGIRTGDPEVTYRRQ